MLRLLLCPRPSHCLKLIDLYGTSSVFFLFACGTPRWASAHRDLLVRAYWLRAGAPGRLGYHRVMEGLCIRIGHLHFVSIPYPQLPELLLSNRGFGINNCCYPYCYPAPRLRRQQLMLSSTAASASTILLLDLTYGKVQAGCIACFVAVHLDVMCLRCLFWRHVFF